MTFLNSCALRTTRICGQPLRASQIRFGRNIAKTMAPPIQIHFDWNRRPLPEIKRPATSAKPKTSIVCLFSRPSPAIAPNASHSLGDAPFTTRIAIHAHKSQNRGSNAFIERKLSNARNAGANIIARAARSCANNPPPSSRAIQPVRKTTAAPASAGRRRTAKSESPKACRANHAISAMSGGWSM